MHIKRLELKNFRGFAKASVDFPEGNVAVFFGWNGAGKTAVLDAVVVSLSDLLNNMHMGHRMRYETILSEDDIRTGEKEVSIKADYFLQGEDQRVI